MHSSYDPVTEDQSPFCCPKKGLLFKNKTSPALSGYIEQCSSNFNMHKKYVGSCENVGSDGAGVGRSLGPCGSPKPPGDGDVGGPHVTLSSEEQELESLMIIWV